MTALDGLLAAAAVLAAGLLVWRLLGTAPARPQRRSQRS